MVGRSETDGQMSLIGPEGRKQLKLAARFLTAGFELAAAIVIGYLGGEYLDRSFGTKYLCFLGLFIGIAAGFRTLYVLAKTAQRQADSSSTHEPPPDSKA
jgi:F0F1-type ATP synthase assembly protein I